MSSPFVSLNRRHSSSSDDAAAEPSVHSTRAMYFTNSSLQQDEAAGLRAPSPSSRVAHYRSVSTDRLAEVASLGGLKGLADHEGQAAPAHYYGAWTGYCFTVNYIVRETNSRRHVEFSRFQ